MSKLLGEAKQPKKTTKDVEEAAGDSADQPKAEGGAASGPRKGDEHCRNGDKMLLAPRRQ